MIDINETLLLQFPPNHYQLIIGAYVVLVVLPCIKMAFFGERYFENPITNIFHRVCSFSAMLVLIPLILILAILVKFYSMGDIE